MVNVATPLDVQQIVTTLCKSREGEAGPMETSKLAKGNTVAPDERKSGQNSGWHGFGVFDKAVSSWFDNVSEEHGLTEDGKTVPPFSRISLTNAFPYQLRNHPIF